MSAETHVGHSHEAVGKTTDGLGRAFAIAIALNVAFVAIEATAGALAGSTALVADALHNLSDVLGLTLAWGATALARRASTVRHTYGLGRATIFAALANGLLVYAAVGALAWDAVQRLFAPPAVNGKMVMIVAGAGVVVNSLSALLFRKAARSDLNVRGALVHLAGDAAVSLGVLASGLVVWRTGLRLVDPLMGIMVSAVILFGTWRLLRESVRLALDGVPAGVRLDEVQRFLGELPGVVRVHDLHVWALSTTDTALSVHLAVAWSEPPLDFLGGVSRQLEERFAINHTTIQCECPSERAACMTCHSH